MLTPPGMGPSHKLPSLEERERQLPLGTSSCIGCQALSGQLWVRAHMGDAKWTQTSYMHVYAYIYNTYIINREFGGDMEGARGVK